MEALRHCIAVASDVVPVPAVYGWCPREEEGSIGSSTIMRGPSRVLTCLCSKTSVDSFLLATDDCIQCACSPLRGNYVTNRLTEIAV